MKPEFTSILFDLDGTIVDSAPGITASLAHTFEDLGLPVPSPAELVAYVGPPILDSFRDLAGFTPEESAKALAIYRVHYLSEGVFDATVYPGIPDLLRTEALEQRKTLRAHWAHLVVHGSLHLIGYDHERDTDARRMERREIAVLRRLGFTNPYLSA
jgi:beta-phosphoglucomutase-like phosphatase (HAD superfamily)